MPGAVPSPALAKALAEPTASAAGGPPGIARPLAGDARASDHGPPGTKGRDVSPARAGSADLDGAISDDPPPAPDLAGVDSRYARLAAEAAEPFARAALVLALVETLRPRRLDLFHTRNTTFGRRFTGVGGVRAGPDGDFQPTGETLASVLGGDLDTRLAVAPLLGPDAPLTRRELVRTGRGQARPSRRVGLG